MNDPHRFGLGARTGGLNDNHWIDDLLITTIGNPGPAVIAVQPASQSVSEGLRASFRVAPDGTPPFSYQWFRNGAGIAGATSGSRSAPMRVMYDWEFIAEEAAHERVLYEEHALFDAPWALWYPVLPGVAGIHNLLMSLQCGRPPERWFSQLDPAHVGPEPPRVVRDLDRPVGEEGDVNRAASRRAAAPARTRPFSRSSRS